MTETQPDKIVSRILELWEAGKYDEDYVLEGIKTEFNMSSEAAESVIELTKTGCFRAQLIATGQKYPKNNLNSDPIVKSAIKLALLRAGRPELNSTRIQKSKPRWKFW